MIDLINQISQGWWSWMGAMFWQASLLILIVSVIDIVIRKWAWPQVRYALWLLVLIKLLIPPSLSSPTGIIPKIQPKVQEQIEQQLKETYHVQTKMQKTETTKVKGEFRSSTAMKPAEKKNSEKESKVLSPTGPGTKPTWKSYFFGIWFTGMILFLALLIRRIAKLRRWHREQEERKTIPNWFHQLMVQTAQRLKSEHLPTIVFSKEAVTPAVYGIFRPVLLLPANYTDSLSREEAEHVLLHEMAHLKRGDLWLHGLFLLVQVVYWFNPLLIWMRKQMKHVREICCDLTIANHLREKTKEYRQTLLNKARELLTETVEPGMGFLGIFEEPFKLVARLKWLEKKTWGNRKAIIATVFSVTLFMVACVLPMASVNKGTISNHGSSNQNNSIKRSSTISPASSSEFSKSNTAKEVYRGKLEVNIKETEPLYAAVLPRIGSDAQVDQAVDKLKTLLTEAGIKPKGHAFGRFFSKPGEAPDEQKYWEVGFPVAPGTKVKPPLEIIHVSKRQVASTIVKDVKDPWEVWQLFIEAIKKKDLIPAFPPAMEIWRSSNQNKKTEQVTEMQIPVFSPIKGYPGMEIKLKEIKPFYAIVLPMMGSYSQHPGAMQKLENYIKEKGIKITGAPFGQYYSDPSKVPPPLYSWKVGYPVKEGTEATLPFKIQKFDKTKVASVVMHGPAQMEYPWSVLIMQIAIKGNMPAGPAMEIWHEKHGNENSYIEMSIPVLKMKDFSENMAEWGKKVENDLEKMRDAKKEKNKPGDGNKPILDAADESALAWLRYVDSGDYKKSWQEADQMFKDLLSQKKWEQLYQQNLPELGKVISRKFSSFTYPVRELPPGIPTGDYIVIKYSTQFSKRGTLQETLLLFKKKNNPWRVARYEIK